jgi:very-short-patch-repair endonuclease
MAEKGANPDSIVANIAARQHGVASVAQLRAAGLSADAVLGRVRAGRLHRLHRGVYAVGHLGLTVEGRWMAAVLACGERAMLSHRSAASLWALLLVAPGPVDVLVPSGAGRRRRTGIRLHRCASLDPRDGTRRFGIPVTGPRRTLEDLRPLVAPEVYRRALRQAEVSGLSVGSKSGDGDRTRSELEFLFLRLCRRHRLPTPEVNVRVGRLVVDFLWPAQRLVVETDGYRYHRGATAFEDDHGRDMTLHELGYEVIRLTYRQVTTEPKRVVARIRRTLAPSSAMSR